MHSHPKLTAVTQLPTEIFLPPKAVGYWTFSEGGGGQFGPKCDLCLPESSISHLKNSKGFARMRGHPPPPSPTSYI